MYSGCCQSNRWSSGLLPSIATFPLFFPFLTTSSASHMSKRKKQNKTKRGEARAFRRVSSIHGFPPSEALPFSGHRRHFVTAPCISSGKTQACETRVRSLNSTTSRHPRLCSEPEPCCFSPKTTHLTRHSTPTSTFFKAHRIQLI